MDHKAASTSQALKGQCAVITGAAQGIGLEIALRFAREGANLVLADLSADSLDAAATQCEKLGASVGICAGDLSKEAVCQSLLACAEEKFGGVQILVNCAGGGVILPFLEHTNETLETTINRNLWTVIRCCHVFLPGMVRAGYGRVVNLGADSVRNGLWDHAAYNAAKGGVHALTTGLAREFAMSGITVNTVAPCAVATPQLVAFRKNKPELADKFLSVIPMGRAAEMSEVASLVAYLAQPEAGYITGQTISINGGSTML